MLRHDLRHERAVRVGWELGQETGGWAARGAAQPAAAQEQLAGLLLHKQVGNVQAKCLREPFHAVDRHVALGSLDRPDVGPVKSSLLR